VDSNENYRSLIRCIGWFGLIIPKLRNITQVVRILPPPRAWIGVRLAHAKPKCFGDSRDAKNDSIWAARREMQRRIPPCTELHGRYRRPKELARNAKKPWENQGFLAERTGTELFPIFPVIFTSKPEILRPNDSASTAQTSHCGSRSGS
jgi:hypothetical protein